MKLAIKVDVDTLKGYREGVPRLLELFERRQIRASIFFSFGPDNSGKAIRRIFRKGFISKMARTKAPALYGLKTLLYGTLLPAPLIVPSDPAIFRAAAAAHDCGMHAWDHVYAQDNLYRISREEFLMLFEKAAKIFEELSGSKVLSYAAPGWQCSGAAFSAVDELGLKYASDTRGYGPFYPVWRGKDYKTVQIPTTLPTMDEILGLPGVTDETLPDIWLKMMTNEWNVLTVHAEMEGISKLHVFERFLEKTAGHGVEFFTLGEAAATAEPLRAAVREDTVAGRAGTLAVQERPRADG